MKATEEYAEGAEAYLFPSRKNLNVTLYDEPNPISLSFQGNFKRFPAFLTPLQAEEH
jgi:hypothetical protein